MPIKNPILWTYVVVDILVLVSGIITLAVVLNTKMAMDRMDVDNVAQNILLENCPLTGGIASAVLTFTGFLISVPAMIFQNNRLFLRIHGWVLVVTALFTLILGLDIWFDTLKSRSNMNTIFDRQTPDIQSLIQQRFECCGFLNADTFQKDSVCTSPLVAQLHQQCASPFNSFANSFLDLVFTADFGFVGLDVILLLCIAMVLKDRKERERYKLIDAKNGFAI